ncbi:AHH domain-containing protein [Myxococcus sp. RHSTA-1-4]|uniref:AHH domain-containing protein n=1 Tax=Myxococcus sp. RHSTA-1-4 TaxID=2874601 RepID=UPI001CBC9263|nr:AHH domain-containing protein [Myxococcus sp. RHSTA-1-4]MBZ4419446.1 AHH domain-containing protein [Myxococcus sp. RHSTA-1-4]
MRVCGIVALLMLATGCATTRVVNLDTGQGAPIVYTPIESDPVEISEEEFKNAVTQLVLDMELNVALNEFERGDSRSLLASAGGIVDGAQGRTVSPSYERICQRQSDPSSCLSLLAGGFTLGPMERRMMALYFALDTVWEGVEEAIKDLTNPAALRAMITTMIGTALVMLVAPEPVTKLIAIALTASLIAYLGTGPVWRIGQGFLRLLEESRDAKNFSELEDAGHHFGKILGDNGARVLVVVALAALGGKNAMAAQGSKLPGAAQAALRAQAEGGFQLSAAYAGEVHAIAVPATGVLNISLAPTAIAAVAMGPGDGIQGDPDGPIHHICTDKNEISEASGGPWTPEFERYFKLAKMDLNDRANLVRIRGHKGPHPREYHQAVLDRIARAMQGCRGAAQCRAALVGELAKIAKDLTTAGTELRKLITKEPGA